MTPDRMTRRELISAAALASAAIALGGRARPLQAADTAKRIPIGLQLYSVRQDCAKDVGAVIAAVGKMGYEGVEFAGYHGKKAEELRKMMDDAGLKCCGTHTGFNTILGDQLKGTIEFNKTLGNKFLIVPGLPGKYTGSKAGWLEVAKIFNDASQKAGEQGMIVGYHNHSVEWKKLEGDLGWDIFAGATKPEVSLQVDFGNAMHGGGDPIAALKKWPGRAKTVHLKEYSKTKAVIGDGEVDWKTVFSICESTAGTEWYIVEDEAGDKTRTPLQRVEQSLKNLKKMGK